MSWSQISDEPDYGRSDFVSECETTWDRRSAQLSARDLELSLDRCRDGLDHLDTLSCSELADLYVGP